MAMRMKIYQNVSQQTTKLLNIHKAHPCPEISVAASTNHLERFDVITWMKRDENIQPFCLEFLNNISNGLTGQATFAIKQIVTILCDAKYCLYCNTCTYILQLICLKLSL